MKKPRVTPAKNCICSLCENEAHSISETYHRRCPGSKGNIRAKRDKLGSNLRGKWV